MNPTTEEVKTGTDIGCAGVALLRSMKSTEADVAGYRRAVAGMVIDPRSTVEV